MCSLVWLLGRWESSTVRSFLSAGPRFMSQMCCCVTIVSYCVAGVGSNTDRIVVFGGMQLGVLLVHC